MSGKWILPDLATALAETVFGDEQAVIRTDIAEYMERRAVVRLIGATGLWGIDEGGQLTVRERRCPRCAILLDAIEKAHPDVDKVLLQFFPPIRALDIAPRGRYCPTT